MINSLLKFCSVNKSTENISLLWFHWFFPFICLIMFSLYIWWNLCLVLLQVSEYSSTWNKRCTLKETFHWLFLWRIIKDIILILITLIDPDNPVFCLIFVKHQVYSNGTWEQITKDLATIKSIKFEYLHQYYALISNFRMYKRRNSFIS